jgi:hypothetical protein
VIAWGSPGESDAAEDGSRAQTAAIPRLGSRRPGFSPKGLIRRREKVSVAVVLGVLSGVDVQPGGISPDRFHLEKVNEVYISASQFTRGGSPQQRCLLHLDDDLVTAEAQRHTGLRACEVHDHTGLVLQPQIAGA